MTSFSKVFEKALYIRVTEHLSTNNLLVGNQFGFRKGTTIKDAIFKLTNEILKALNSKTSAGRIFCILGKLLTQLIMIFYCQNYPIME